jgi:hypothetical protein
MKSPHHLSTPTTTSNIKTKIKNKTPPKSMETDPHKERNNKTTQPFATLKERKQRTAQPHNPY